MSKKKPRKAESNIQEPEKVDEEEKGLVCRNCGCRHFEVLYTRPAWGGRIMRRRICRYCRRRLTTYEKKSGS